MTKTEISISCLSYIYCHCFLINISVSSRICIGMKKESAQKTTFLLFVCMTKLLCPERKLLLMVWFHWPVHMDSHCVLHIYSVFMCFVIYCLGLWTSLPPARWYFISLTCLISCRDREIDCEFGYRDRLSNAGKGSVKNFRSILHRGVSTAELGNVVGFLPSSRLNHRPGLINSPVL